jgi:energy-coupling factor transporter transmembrane protein EcfT
VALDNIPFAYKCGTSALHRLNAGIKLILLLVITSAVFYCGVLFSVFVSILIVVAASLAKIKPWELLRGSRPILLMLLCIIVLRAVRFSGINFFPPGLSGDFKIEFSKTDFFEAVSFCRNVIISFCAGTLLFAVTTVSELKDVLSLINPKLGLAVSLMLGFIPRFFEKWQTMQTAYRARGGKTGIKEILVLIPLVSQRMIDAACETAIAMEARRIG